jgi:hypothetical protein
MAQITLPFRIALVAVLAAGALWMTVLRPKPVDDSAATPPTAPGVTGLVNATAKAREASAVSDKTNARIAQATGQDASAAASKATTPAKATPAKATAPAQKTAQKATRKPTHKPSPAAKKAPAADLSAPLLRALKRGKPVVLVFAGRVAADERAARAAVRTVARQRGGKVLVRIARLADVGRYEAITTDVKIAQSPTILVIGRDGMARTIVGLTTVGEVDQAVGDALAAKKPAAK